MLESSVNMRNKTKERKDIASLISVILSAFSFVLLIIACMFSSYSADISYNEKEIVEEKNIVISFNGSNEVYLKNVNPGTYKNVSFEISSKEDATSIMEYDIYFELENNTFNSENIMYRLEGSSSLKSSSGNIVSVNDYVNFVDYDTPHYHGSVKPGEIQEYNFTIFYSHLSRVSKNLLKGYIRVEVSE